MVGAYDENSNDNSLSYWYFGNSGLDQEILMKVEGTAEL